MEGIRKLKLDLLTKLVLVCAIFFASLGSLLIASPQNSKNLKIIACDVGQGDGLLVVLPDGQQFVVDGGPGTKVENCLSQYMPFWDREVEMMLSTHSQQDHLEGLVGVLSKYRVKTIFTSGVSAKNALYLDWKDALLHEKAWVIVPEAGQRINYGGASIDFLWPKEADEWVWQKTPPSDLNETSLVFRLNYGEFCAYFTGDVPKEILEKIVDRSCQVLKIAHHGSKTGTNPSVLEKALPEVAIIQVGAKNRYGHPTPEVLQMLESKGVKTYRNDTNGVIEIVSDGKTYSVKAERE